MRTALWPAALLTFSLVMIPNGSNPKEAGEPKNYVLFFEVLNYTRELGDAVTFFFDHVLAPDDQLIIYTPARVYGFSKDTLAKSKRELSESMKEKLRGDTAACSSDYKTILHEMKNQADAIEGGQTASADGRMGIKSSLTMYRQDMENLLALRRVNEPLLLKIVEMFKNQPGENHMVMIYEAEFRPIPNKETLSRLRAIPDLAFIVAELFASDDQKSPLDAPKFIDLLTEANISLHFLYIKPKDRSSVQDFKEHSGDMYDVFSQIAKATGGIVETTANPHAALKLLTQTINE
jgi:hypothetical protein